MLALVELEDGQVAIPIDLDADLGNLTPAEVTMLNAYVQRSGLDPDRAMAGGYILIQLHRQLDVDPETLIRAVI